MVHTLFFIPLDDGWTPNYDSKTSILDYFWCLKWLNHIKSPFIQCLPNASTCHLPQVPLLRSWQRLCCLDPQRSNPDLTAATCDDTWIIPPKSGIMVKKMMSYCIGVFLGYFWDIGFLWNIEGIWNPWCPACPLVPHLGTEKHHNSGRICLADVAKRPFKDCTSLCLTCVRQFLTLTTWPPWSHDRVLAATCRSLAKPFFSQLSYVSNVWRGRRLARQARRQRHSKKIHGLQESMAKVACAMLLCLRVEGSVGPARAL